MKYQYLNGKKPARKCPLCDYQWLKMGGLILMVSVQGVISEYETCLDRQGYLNDVGGLISNGCHSATFCGRCNEMLINMEEIHEVSVSPV